MADRYRVKVRSPHTVREYVVTADSRDEAWLLVDARRQNPETALPPDRTIELPEMVFWASDDDDDDEPR